MSNKIPSKALPLLTSCWEGAIFFLCLCAFMLISTSSCDESSVIGLDVQPLNDLLNVVYQDTATINAKTVLVDSLRTDETLIITADALLGKYIDPVFGAATASLYSQLRLPTNNPVFGTNPQIDSVILALVYSPSYYGKRICSEQRINVYEVLEEIKGVSNYYSNNTLITSTVDLANDYAFTPAPSKSLTINNEVLKPQLRVPLSNAFGASILNNQNLPNLATNTAFQSFIKGLYVSTENTSSLISGEGNMLNFKMADPQSKIILYYHNDTDDSLKYDLSFGSVARFSHFTHNYANGIDGDLAAQLSVSPIPAVENDVVFIQSMAGVKTKIEFPYIMNLLNSGSVAINKAELVIKVDVTPSYQLDTFAAPENLVLFGIHDDGSSFVLADLNEGANYFGGKYNAVTHEYRFNIARYIQQVISGKIKNNGLHLLASNGAIAANRIVIGGGAASSSNRMKLNIGFTILQ